jgi:hypothetical protein
VWFSHLLQSANLNETSNLYALTLSPSPQNDASSAAAATKHVISMVEDELKTNNPDFKFELAGKNQESKFLMSYKGNTRLAGKTLNDWNNCYTAYILRPVQRKLDAATGSVTPTATWEFVIKDGRVMAKYKTTHVEPPVIASPRETPEVGGTPPTTFDVWMDMIRKDDGHKELQRYFLPGSNGNLYVSLLALSVYHTDTDWSLGMMRKYGYDSISGHQHCLKFNAEGPNRLLEPVQRVGRVRSGTYRAVDIPKLQQSCIEYCIKIIRRNQIM